MRDSEDRGARREVARDGDGVVLGEGRAAVERRGRVRPGVEDATHHPARVDAVARLR